MSKATKQQKDKLQELADKQMLLPSIDYFVGRKRGMHEMLTYARPQIEKLLVKQRREAVDAIMISRVSIKKPSLGGQSK
jgi:hypothetical protein